MGNYGDVAYIGGPCGSGRIPNPSTAPKFPTVMSELEMLGNTLDHIGKLTLELEERLGVLLTTPSDTGGVGRPMDADSALTRQVLELNNKALNVVTQLIELRRRIDL
jgi:hypothetical protein